MSDRGDDERLQISGIRLMSEESAHYRGLQVPEWFDAMFTGHGSPNAVEIRVRVRPDDRLIAAGVMTFGDLTYRDAVEALKHQPLADLLHEATLMSAGSWAWQQGRRELSTPDQPDPEVTDEQVKKLIAGIQAANDAARAVPPPSRQRRVIVPALLREVAGVYRDAMDAGRPPTLAVAEKYHTSHRTAARWVSEARKQGYLNPAPGPMAGERPQD